MFIHCHSVHDYPALPPEAAYKWPLKREGQGVGRAEWPGCWLWHSLTALSRSLFSHLFGVSRGSQIKRSMNKSRAQLLPPREIEMRNWGWMEVFLNVRMDLNKIWRVTSGVVALLYSYYYSSVRRNQSFCGSWFLLMWFQTNIFCCPCDKHFVVVLSF